MATKLVIVESPTKAHKIGDYLGKGYTVMASVGHIRDLRAAQPGARGRTRPSSASSAWTSTTGSSCITLSTATRSVRSANSNRPEERR